MGVRRGRRRTRSLASTPQGARAFNPIGGLALFVLVALAYSCPAWWRTRSRKDVAATEQKGRPAEPGA